MQQLVICSMKQISIGQSHVGKAVAEKEADRRRLWPRPIDGQGSWINSTKVSDIYGFSCTTDSRESHVLTLQSPPTCLFFEQVGLPTWDPIPIEISPQVIQIT